MRRSTVFGRTKRKSKGGSEDSGALGGTGDVGGRRDTDGEALDRALTGYERTFRELLTRLREVEEQWEELGRLIKKVPDIAACCWGEAVADTVGTLGTSLPPGGPITGMQELVQLTTRIQRIRVLWRKRRECVENREAFRAKLDEWAVKSEGETKKRKTDEYRERIAIAAQEVEDITSIIQEHLRSFDKDHSQILANVLRGFAEASQRRTANDPFGFCVKQLAELAMDPPSKTLLQFGDDPPKTASPMQSLSQDSSQKTPPGTPPPASQGSVSVGKSPSKSPDKESAVESKTSSPEKLNGKPGHTGPAVAKAQE